MSARIGVVQFPGTNCELDVVHAVEQLGGSAEILFHTERDLRRRRRGRGPRRLRPRRLPAHRRDRPVLAGDGVGRRARGRRRPGRRHLQRLPGALRGRPAPRRAAEERGAEVPLRDRRRPGRDAPRRCSRARPATGDVLRIPINHFEGNYVCSPETLAELRAEDRVVVRYVDNPNGSLDDIAGICNAAGNVVGLMPHPERASDALLGSADGVVLLRSLLAAATNAPRSSPRERRHEARAGRARGRAARARDRGGRVHARPPAAPRTGTSTAGR